MCTSTRRRGEPIQSHCPTQKYIYTQIYVYKKDTMGFLDKMNIFLDHIIDWFSLLYIGEMIEELCKELIGKLNQIITT